MVANCSPAEITAVRSEPQSSRVKNGHLAPSHTAARGRVLFGTAKEKRGSLCLGETVFLTTCCLEALASELQA